MVLVPFEDIDMYVSGQLLDQPLCTVCFVSPCPPGQVCQYCLYNFTLGCYPPVQCVAMCAGL